MNFLRKRKTREGMRMKGEGMGEGRERKENVAMVITECEIP